VSIRPLLKWAGGKRQLLPALRPYYPATFDRYVEPFLGSGAVFFDLLNAGHLEGRAVALVDMNQDLIGCYRRVRDDADGVIAALSSLEEEHRRHGAACYYEVRDRRFNPARAALGDRAAVAYTAPLAAMLLYLNRTGFNGLFRLNRRGAYNVPVGRYVDPAICDPANIRAVARALGAAGVSLDCGPFDRTLARARRGDFIYCDPPYAPLSRTSSFAGYTAAGFTAADQGRLQDAVVEAAGRGAVVLVSNSSAPEIEEGYSTRAARGAGLAVRRVAARRAINSRATRRGPVDELIISNALAPGRGSLRMAAASLSTTGRIAKRAKK
jgi:DNA adenine methylase